ncbi:MAG: hypothetical protein HYS41_06850 [Candidatus Omnitrophica bacterium]|nr:hypothetical protein [Candidatus Omnitrophota bacterium]
MGYEVDRREWTAYKAVRQCQDCDKSHEVTFDSTILYTDVACLECERCQALFWYNAFNDPVWDRRKEGLKNSEGWKLILESLPPCSSCGGHLIRTEDWLTRGAPKHCPFCKKEQKDTRKELKASDPSVKQVKEDIFWITYKVKA